MRKHVDAATIGAFVVGALALCVAAIVIWGSGRLFRETARFVCYFEGSLEGLEVGAPVKIRGVPVGQVTRILLRYRQRPEDDRLPVFVEIDLKRLMSLGAGRPGPAMIDGLIARGLRARLETQSFVTGTLFVNVGQFPNTPVKLAEVDPQHGYVEIPTVPRPFAELSESMTAIVSKLQSVDLSAVAESIDGAASVVSKKVPETLAAFTAMTDTYRELGRELGNEVPPLLSELKRTIADAQTAVVGVSGAAGATSRLVAPEAPLSVRLGDALGQVGRAADALRNLADYLQRNPNALIVGKSAGR